MFNDNVSDFPTDCYMLFFYRHKDGAKIWQIFEMDRGKTRMRTIKSATAPLWRVPPPLRRAARRPGLRKMGVQGVIFQDFEGYGQSYYCYSGVRSY